jgi:hypothetical protein
MPFRGYVDLILTVQGTEGAEGAQMPGGAGWGMNGEAEAFVDA